MYSKLLEEISEDMNTFISQLKSEEFLQGALEVLRSKIYSDYSKEEWNYCLTYLLGSEVTLEDGDEVKSYLREHSQAVKKG